MKKRVLSMLLLVVMIVAALPLAALTVLAAEEETPIYNAEDYNALYVQDGLVYAADWFSSNTHWGEIGAVANTTDHAAANTAFNNGRWFATNVNMNLSFSTSYPVDVVVAGGAFVANKIETGTKHTNSTFTGSLADAMGRSYQGSAMEIVRTFPSGTGSTLFLNDTRIAVSTAGKLTDLYNISQYEGWIAKADGTPVHSYNGRDAEGNTFRNPTIALDTPTAPHSYLFNVTRVSGEVFTDRHKYMDGSSTKYESVKIYETKTIYVTGEEGSYTVVDEGTEGAIPLTVIDTSKDPASGGTSNATYGRNNPCVLVTAGYTYDGTTLTAFDHSADTATQAANIYVAVDRYTAAEGSVSFYQDGNELINEENVAFLNNTYGDQTNMHHWNDGYGAIYALRYYSRELTAAEAAQNHFADLAKFFRADITGYDVIDAELLPDVYAAVAEYGFESDADTVKEAIRTAIFAAVAESSAYTDLKVDGEEERNAVIDIAASVLGDTRILGRVFRSPRDMSAVYAAVIAAHAQTPFTSKTAFDAFLEEQYVLAYNYNAYKTGDALHDAFITAAAAADLEIEALMALPYAERVAFYEAQKGDGDFAAVDQAAINAYVSTAMEKYAEYEVAEPDYDALYVQEGLIFAADFFKLNNPYWPEVSHMAFSDVDTSSLDAALTHTHTCTASGSATCTDGNHAKDGISYAASTELQKAASDWKTNVEKPWFEQFYTKQASKKLVFASHFGGLTTTAQTHAAFTPGNGYIQIRNDGRSDNGLTLDGTAALPLLTDNVSQQLVMAPMATNGNFTFLYNIRPRLNADGAITAVSNFTPAGTVTPGTPIPMGENVLDLTLTLTGGKTTGNNTDVFSVRNGSETVFSVTGNYSSQNGTMYLGYTNSSNMKLYAYRLYNEELTNSEIAQNHFADLAKYYRLEIITYDWMNADQKAYVHEAMLSYTVGAYDRDEVQAAYLEAAAIYYEDLNATFSTDPEINAAFLEIVNAYSLDVTGILGVDPASFAETAKAFVEMFDIDYAQSRAIMMSVLNSSTGQYDAVTFAGYQVCVDTGAAIHNKVGVRATFDVDKALLAELAANGATVKFGAELYVAGDDTAKAALEFSYNAETGEITGINTTSPEDPTAAPSSDAKLYERTLADGSKVTSFNYTLVYTAEHAADPTVLAKEFSYKYYIEIDGEKYVLSAHSRFGETVSAFELYEYFSTTERYAEDRVVNAVVALLPAAD